MNETGEFLVPDEWNSSYRNVQLYTMVFKNKFQQAERYKYFKYGFKILKDLLNNTTHLYYQYGSSSSKLNASTEMVFKRFNCIEETIEYLDQIEQSKNTLQDLGNFADEKDWQKVLWIVIKLYNDLVVQFENLKPFKKIFTQKKER